MHEAPLQCRRARLGLTSLNWNSRSRAGETGETPHWPLAGVTMTSSISFPLPTMDREVTVEAGSRRQLRLSVCERELTKRDVEFAQVRGLDYDGDRPKVRLVNPGIGRSRKLFARARPDCNPHDWKRHIALGGRLEHLDCPRRRRGDQLHSAVVDDPGLLARLD